MSVLQFLQFPLWSLVLPHGLITMELEMKMENFSSELHLAVTRHNPCFIDYMFQLLAGCRKRDHICFCGSNDGYNNSKNN